jgi:hypothetical protein
MGTTPFILIACADGRHDLCDGFARGTNRPCECHCHTDPQPEPEAKA